jgi:glycerol-3-phosphate O-acyltransferase
LLLSFDCAEFGQVEGGAQNVEWEVESGRSETGRVQGAWLGTFTDPHDGMLITHRQAECRRMM